MRSVLAVTGLLTGALALQSAEKPTCEVVISAKYEKSKHHKKAIGYISFDNNDASLVSSRDRASEFTASQDGFLMSNESYVGAVSGTGFAVLERSTNEPLFPTFWDVSLDAEVSYKNEAFTYGNGKAVFCVAQDNVIFSLYTTAPPFGCKELALTAEYRDPECTPAAVEDEEDEEIKESGLELRSLEGRNYNGQHWKPKYHKKPMGKKPVKDLGGSYDECGFRNGQCCAEGLCCSQYGYCGRTEAYCGKGCLGDFGSCGLKSHPMPAHSKPNYHKPGPHYPSHQHPKPAHGYPSHPHPKPGHGYPSHPQPAHGYPSHGHPEPGHGYPHGNPPHGYPSHPAPPHGYKPGHYPEHPKPPHYGGHGSYDECGFRNGQTCAEGLCCSPHGYCGASDAYCGKGCLRSFGKCGPKSGYPGHPGHPSYPSHPTPTHPHYPDKSSEVDEDYEYRQHEQKRNIVDEA